MTEKCVIDTSLLIKVILEGDMDVLIKLADFVSHIPVNVLEETSFKIVISSVLDSLNLEWSNFYRIKTEFEKGRGKELIADRLHLLNTIKNKMIVLELNDDIFDISKEIVKKYYLLPNDALIAATCNYYGIKKIATFDSDFERVEFLEVVTV